jgi:methylglyoxal reductase
VVAPLDPEPLGRTDLRVAPIVFGTMARSAASGAEREDLVRRALDLGLHTLDTAPLYEQGDSERWIGRAIRGRRDEVVLATKVGLRWDDDHGDVMFSFSDEDGRTLSVRKDSRPSAVRADVEGSLQRLGVDVLDLVQIHQPDRHTPIESTMDALLALKEEGKIRAIGISNFDLRQTEAAAAALGREPLACLQLRYSLLDRGLERGVGRWAARRGVSIWAYSPLAEGVLARGPRPGGGSWLTHPSNAQVLRDFTQNVIEPIAARHGCSRATVALAWLRTRPGVHPVVGASRAEHLEQAAAAAHLRLSPGDVSILDEASRRLKVNRRVGRRRRDRVIGRVRRLARRLLGR